MLVDRRVDTFMALYSRVENNAAMEINVLRVKMWLNLTDVVLN